MPDHSGNRTQPATLERARRIELPSASLATNHGRQASPAIDPPRSTQTPKKPSTDLRELEPLAVRDAATSYSRQALYILSYRGIDWSPSKVANLLLPRFRGADAYPIWR